MKILMITNRKGNAKDTIETGLSAELTHRGHEVSMIDINDLDKREKSASGQRTHKQGLLQKVLLDQPLYRAEHILVPSLRTELLSQQYDMILPTQIYAAEVLSALLEGEENISAHSAFVSSECDFLPRKACLACDDYIVMSKQAIRSYMDWGINAARIHYIDESGNAIPKLCDLIESLGEQWMEMVRSLDP